ncbi:TAP-like protein-domain-containing protein [Aspergillus granulosus]|uniref:TAP-like protein-domain-containing protein n=1 Tax=Aspergillus granulosus TaxID=176169 RepID=A0ABR4H556_9EURO
MTWKSIALQASLLASSFASPSTPLESQESDRISWSACEIELPGIQCANFSVPLDYTDLDSEATLNLQLLRVPAVAEQKKGSILFNFGGPGFPSRFTLAALASRFLALTGGEYDLVAHDPRGTGTTLTASCFNTTVERQLAVGIPMQVVPSTDDELALGRLFGQTQVVANSCNSFPGFAESGSLIGTAFGARDLMQIVDAIEDDGLLRFWGISYGTALGATVAAMFPDRIDRILIDAVLNPHEYFNSYEIELWADADRTFFNMLIECLRTPDLCALGSRRTKAVDLEKDIYNLIDDLREEPVVSGTTLIDSSTVITFIRFALYDTASFPGLAAGLEALLSGNPTEFADIYNDFVNSGRILTITADDSPFAITCGDKDLPEQTFAEMQPVFKALEKESRLLGSNGHILASICQNWDIQAKERYTGNFEATTRHPMLIVGNTFDSATSLQSAVNVSASFEGSVVLEHGGFGHGSTIHGSACTINAIRDYFTNGTLPKPGTVCEVNYPPFQQDMTIDNVLINLGYLPEPEEQEA